METIELNQELNPIEPLRDENIQNSKIGLRKPFNMRRISNILKSCIGILISVVALILAGFKQYNEFSQFSNRRILKMNSTLDMCDFIFIQNIDKITSILSVLLLTIFIIFHQLSESKEVLNWRFNNWSKNNRADLCLIYGIVSYHIFTMIRKYMTGISNSTNRIFLSDVHDPTGLLKLFIKVLEIFSILLSKFRQIENSRI